MRRLLASFVLCAAVSGCATLEPVAVAETEGADYRVELPIGWMRLPDRGGSIAVTRDGAALQRIAVARHDAEQAFPILGKRAEAALLPSELAALHIAEMKRSEDVRSVLEVIENTPARVGGERGFRVRIRFRTTQGLAIEEEHFGIAHAGHFYVLSYSAPSLYYFPKYRPAFEKVVSSFRLM